MVQKINIDELLTRGVGDFIDPNGDFRKKLETNPEKIVIKLGIDPNRPDIHIGHAVALRKLRQFQDLGCKVVFLIGDYTAQIGDPTGKSKTRPEIEQAEVEKNMKTFIDQVGKILKTDTQVFSWIRNSDWFTAITDLVFPAGERVHLDVEQNGKKISIDTEANSFIGKALMFEKTRMQVKITKNISVITLRSFLWALKHITHAQLIERDMFQERIKKGEELYLHELMYPVLQGIDSFVLSQIYGSCDLEVGGTDQHFNMLMGRTVMKTNKVQEQAVLTFKLLEGTDGKEKMSKSLDNYIAITDTPADMYGKVLSIPDTSIVNYFELCTYTSLERIKEITEQLTGGKVNPKDLKMELARQIVAEYHGEQESQKAEADFIQKFQKKEIPDSLEELNASKGDLLVDILLKGEIVSSKTDFRRLVEDGAITDLNTKEKINDPLMAIIQTVQLKVGKKRFVRITI